MIGRIWFAVFDWAGVTNKGHGALSLTCRPFLGLGKRRRLVLVNIKNGIDAPFFDIGWRDSQGRDPLGALSYHELKDYWATKRAAGELVPNVVLKNLEGWA